MAKVIHVHLTHPLERSPRRDWYFSSITAVFTALSPEEVGATKSYLLHAGLSGGGAIITRRAIIRQSELIGSRRKGME